jgi:hypothetical protein
VGVTEFFIFIAFPGTLIFRYLITEPIRVVGETNLIQCRNTRSDNNLTTDGHVIATSCLN